MIHTGARSDGCQCFIINLSYLVIYLFIYLFIYFKCTRTVQPFFQLDTIIQDMIFGKVFIDGEIVMLGTLLMLETNQLDKENYC